MRRKDEELRRSMLKTLEMNYTSRNLRSKPDRKKEKRLKREKESDKSC
jgi:hypothetical protein